MNIIFRISILIWHYSIYTTKNKMNKLLLVLLITLVIATIAIQYGMAQDEEEFQYVFIFNSENFRKF